MLLMNATCWWNMRSFSHFPTVTLWITKVHMCSCIMEHANDAVLTQQTLGTGRICKHTREANVSHLSSKNAKHHLVQASWITVFVCFTSERIENLWADKTGQIQHITLGSFCWKYSIFSMKIIVTSSSDLKHHPTHKDLSCAAANIKMCCCIVVHQKNIQHFATNDKLHKKEKCVNCSVAKCECGCSFHLLYVIFQCDVKSQWLYVGRVCVCVRQSAFAKARQQ